jgi:hypothetical protein
VDEVMNEVTALGSSSAIGTWPVAGAESHGQCAVMEDPAT